MKASNVLKKHRKATITKLQCPSEEEEGKTLAKWLDMRGVLYCHVPNGGKRNIVTAEKLKAQGVKAGVPDYLIFENGKDCYCAGVAIELKRVSNSKTTAKQKQWLKDLEDRGWLTYIAYGADDAINWLKGLGF